MPYFSVAGFHSTSTGICLPWSAADQLFHILFLCNLVLSAELSPLSHEGATILQKLNLSLSSFIL